MAKRVTLGVFCLFFVACAASEEERRQDAVLTQQVRVSKSDPDRSCEELGGVEGRSAFDYDTAVRAMRKKAAAKGANYVRIDTVVGTYALSGVVFRCPPVAPASPPPTSN